MNVIEFRDANYVNGSWVAPLNGQVETVINPADETSIGKIRFADTKIVGEAVNSARAAQRNWSQLTGAERGKYLRTMAAAILARQERLVAIQMLNNAKPRQEAINDIVDAAGCLDYYADMATALDGKQGEPAPYEKATFGSRFHYHAVGVVGLILPWNFPFKICSWKLGPALAAGCSVVIKPSPVTPFVENEWADIAEEAGLPPGVINIVHGEGDVGSALVNHPDVAKISFTGSTRTGSAIMKDAASDIKRIGLELGGKSPIIVFEDADLELAARLVLEGIFYNCGQCCNATGRLLVQEGIYEPLVALLKEKTERIVVSGPDNPAAEMGPLVSTMQYEKVKAYFEVAKEEGLSVLTGGAVSAAHDVGYFVQPTIYSDVPMHSRLWREEIFGPVLTISRFSDEEDTVRLANDSEYGLAATVVSEQADRADRIADQLDAGHIYLNTSVTIPPQTMWGGFKKSGLGRELGTWGLSGFLEPKAVTFRK